MSVGSSIYNPGNTRGPAFSLFSKGSQSISFSTRPARSYSTVALRPWRIGVGGLAAVYTACERS